MCLVMVTCLHEIERYERTWSMMRLVATVVVMVG